MEYELYTLRQSLKVWFDVGLGPACVGLSAGNCEQNSFSSEFYLIQINIIRLSLATQVKIPT